MHADGAGEVKVGDFVRITGPCRVEEDLDLRGQVGMVRSRDFVTGVGGVWAVETVPGSMRSTAFDATLLWDFFLPEDLELVEADEETATRWMLHDLSQ
jgi:hypothetical protein